jgi:lipid-A-disaccharide synthase
VVYKISRLAKVISAPFIKCRFISLVNLLAGEEVYPEYLTCRDRSGEVAGHVLRWLADPAARAATVRRLQELREWVAVPGACERAAAFLLDAVRAQTDPRAWAA